MTTDADRVACTMQVLHDIVSGWRCDTLDGFEALAKVRALLSGGEPAKVRDESRDDLMRGVDKLRGQLERAIGEARRRASVGGNISLSLAEHLAVLANAALEKLAGYAPQGAPPNPLCPLHSGELECLCGEES